MYEINIPWDRVNRAKDRIDTAFSHIQPDLLPMDFRVNGYNWDKISMRERMLNHSLALKERVDFINYQYEYFPDNDFLPVLDVNTGEVVIPSIFGIKYEYPENSMPVCMNNYIITDVEKDIDKIMEISKDDILKNDLVKHAFERIEFFLEKTQRKLPVSFFDMQSPLTIASRLIDTDKFFMYMYDYPEKISDLLSYIADIIIILMKEQIKIIGDDRLLNVEINTGLASSTKSIIYDDYSSMLGAKIYREICYDANSKIMKTFGNGHIHSCGPVWDVIDTLLEYDDLYSFDFVFLKDKGKTTKELLEVKKKCIGKVAFVSKSIPDMSGKTNKNFFDISDHITLSDEENITPEWIRSMNEKGGVLIRSAGTPEKGQKLREIIKKGCS